MSAVNPIFIHTRINGDMNRTTYSKKQLNCIKNETRTQVRFFLLHIREKHL
jgi:hypothetical protein